MAYNLKKQLCKLKETHPRHRQYTQSKAWPDSGERGAFELVNFSTATRRATHRIQVWTRKQETRLVMRSGGQRSADSPGQTNVCESNNLGKTSQEKRGQQRFTELLVFDSWLTVNECFEIIHLDLRDYIVVVAAMLSAWFLFSWNM